MVALRRGFLHRHTHHIALLHGRHVRKERVHLKLPILRHLRRYQLPSFLALAPEIAVAHEVGTLLAAFLVRQHLHRVNRLHQLHEVLRHMLVLQHRLVVTVELRVKIYQHLLLRKGLPAVGHILLRLRGALLLLAQVLKRLAVVEPQHKVLLILRERQPPRVCHHHRSVLKTIRIVVNHQVLEHTRLRVFVADIDIVALDSIIELAHRNLQLRRFLPERENKRPQFHLRLG